MSIGLYDEALYNKINSWVKDKNLVILKPDESARLLKTKADQIGDKPIRLPMISISRYSDINLKLNTKNVLSFDGVQIGHTKTETLHMDGIPIDLKYQLNIYTKRYDEADEYVRNFAFQIINHPKLTITIPYNGKLIDVIAYMRLGATLTDNSDIPEKMKGFDDQFTRWTMEISIHDAYLWSVPYSTNWSVKCEGVQLEIDNKDGTIEVEPITKSNK